MKKLQNNFTTVEQAKRLMELEVPVDSADCYYLSLGKNTSNFGHPKYCYKPYTELSMYDYSAIYTLCPCWSMGRLIEILHITYKQDWREYLYMCTTETCSKGLINQIMQYLEKYHKDHDFSKLED